MKVVLDMLLGPPTGFGRRWRDVVKPEIISLDKYLACTLNFTGLEIFKQHFCMY